MQHDVCAPRARGERERRLEVLPLLRRIGDGRGVFGDGACALAEVLRVAARERRGVHGLERLRRERSNAFAHREAHRPMSLDPQDVLGGEIARERSGRRAELRRDRVDRVKRERAAEHGAPTQELALGGLE